MEYIYPTRFKQSKKDEEQGRKVYTALIWYILGTIAGFIILQIILWARS